MTDPEAVRRWRRVRRWGLLVLLVGLLLAGVGLVMAATAASGQTISPEPAGGKTALITAITGLISAIAGLIGAVTGMIGGMIALRRATRPESGQEGSSVPSSEA